MHLVPSSGGVPITQLGLSPQAIRVLQNAGIARLNQLAGYRRADLLRLERCGRKTSSEIMAAIKTHLWTGQSGHVNRSERLALAVQVLAAVMTLEPARNTAWGARECVDLAVNLLEKLEQRLDGAAMREAAEG